MHSYGITIQINPLHYMIVVCTLGIIYLMYPQVLSLRMKSHGVTIQLKPLKQYFTVRSSSF